MYYYPAFFVWIFYRFNRYKFLISLNLHNLVLTFCFYSNKWLINLISMSLQGNISLSLLHEPHCYTWSWFFKHLLLFGIGVTKFDLFTIATNNKNTIIWKMEHVLSLKNMIICTSSCRIFNTIKYDVCPIKLWLCESIRYHLRHCAGLYLLIQTDVPFLEI